MYKIGENKWHERVRECGEKPSRTVQVEKSQATVFRVNPGRKTNRLYTCICMYHLYTIKKYKYIRICIYTMTTTPHATYQTKAHISQHIYTDLLTKHTSIHNTHINTLFAMYIIYYIHIYTIHISIHIQIDVMMTSFGRRLYYNRYMKLKMKKINNNFYIHFSASVFLIHLRHYIYIYMFIYRENFNYTFVCG